MKTKRLYKLWDENWQYHLFFVGFPLILLLVAGWVYVASSFGGADRDREITQLIQASHQREERLQELERLRQVILANPQAFSDPVGELKNAENATKKATDDFENAGLASLGGELIILSGVGLQILIAVLLAFLAHQAVYRFSRVKKMRAELSTTKELYTDLIKQRKFLDKEDELMQFIREWADRSENEKERIQPLLEEYKLLTIKYSRAKRDAPSWSQFAKLLYKIAIACKKANAQEFEALVRDRYKELRKIIRQDRIVEVFSSVGKPIFFLVFFLFGSYLWNQLVGSVLGMQLGFWQLPVTLFGLAFVMNGVIHTVGEPIAKWFTEKTWTDLDDVIVGAIIGPLSALATATFILAALVILTGPATNPLEFGPFLVWVAYIATADSLRTLIVTLVITWFAVFLLNRVIIWMMGKWAERTDQKYDDMFVKVVQVFGSFIILAFGFGAALAALSGPIREATGMDSVLIPYAIIVSVFTAILGYATRAGVENFFGGLLLQIEKPFTSGERIILPDQRICDVREIGMRSTVLYSVLENTEVSVPNSEMSTMIITNTSRPDLELRIEIPIWISTNSRKIKDAEAILLDIAYLEEEVDQMRVFDTELGEEERRHSRWQRSTIAEEFDRISTRNKRIIDTIVSHIIGGGDSESVRIFEEIYYQSLRDPKPSKHFRYEVTLDKIKRLRIEYQRALKEENNMINVTAAEITKDEETPLALSAIHRALRGIVYEDFEWADDKIAQNLRPISLQEGIPIETLQMMVLAISKKLNPETYKIYGQFGVISSNAKERLEEFFETLTQIRKRLVLEVSEQLAELSNYIFAIAEQNSELRPELDRLISELGKEPVVSSTYTVDGHVKITLHCNALYLERRYEIQHKLNRDIERRFHQAGIRFAEPPPPP